MTFTPQALADADPLDFEQEREDWNVYKLSDGTTLKVKLVLQGVKRLRTFNPDGTPIYVINSQNVVRAVNIPPEVHAKPRVSEIKPV
jgi:hypothetical protein